MSNDKKQTDGLSPEVKQMIQDALRQGMAEGMAMMALASKPQGQVAPQYVRGEICGDCRQEKLRCKEKHIKMVVFPKDPRWARWFRGVIINGVTYLSNGPGHEITVPASNDIDAFITRWEENEVVTQHGRVAEHDSGSLGVGGRFNPAFGAFR